MIFSHLTIFFKKTSKKSAKKFAELKKRRTFAPANETISALARRNNTYIDIMLYSTKEDLKNRVKPEVNNLKIGYKKLKILTMKSLILAQDER